MPVKIEGVDQVARALPPAPARLIDCYYPAWDAARLLR